MKLHRNLALAVVAALEAIFDGGQVAARALDALFAAHPKWGKRDRAFVAQTTYEIVRWRRLLAWAAQSDAAWALLGARLVQSGAPLPDWDEFASLDADPLRARLQTPDLPRAVRESLPDWLDELGEAQLGARWDAELRALNGEAPVVLRANTLKISRDELQARLQDEGIATQCVARAPDALRLETRRSVATGALFKAGFFEIQDAASQLVAPFLQVERGQRILDACAGAGGKTLHLAALLQNQGQILAFDVEEAKLAELRRRTARAGVSIVGAMRPDRKDASQLHHHFDRALIDAPCSGLGTLRRQPDLKWRLTPKWLAQIEARQREILEGYAPMLRAGGALVYATCSLLPSENERQIEWFLARHPQWQLEEQKPISCAETGCDGFFMARLRKR